jgi:two-component system cell cycle response regulator CtrA
MNEVSELRRLVEDLAARVVAIEEGFVLDHAQYIAFGLTRSEAILLALLMKRKIASRAAGLAVLYGAMPADEPDGKILDIFVCRIRKALRRHGVGEIRTLQGVGSRDDAFEAWKQRAADADIHRRCGALGAKLKKRARERAGPCPRCGGDRSLQRQHAKAGVQLSRRRRRRRDRDGDARARGRVSRGMRDHHRRGAAGARNAAHGRGERPRPRRRGRKPRARRAARCR